MSDREIYVGVWTNWSLGSILGLTLTIPLPHGIVLIAVLALLVRWAGSRFWGVICYSLHHLDSSHGSYDGLHLQRRAILRSKMTETDFIWRMYELGWAWKTQTASFRRSLPFAILAIMNIAIWLTAGIFSAKITKTNGEDLVRGRCGWLELSAKKDFLLWNQSDWNAGDVLFVASYHNYRDSLQYSQSCYTGALLKASKTQCQAHVIPLIASSMDHNAPCPFSPETCTGPGFTIDSGPVDSRYHLGMNVRDEDRLEIRKVISCAPIDMETYSTPYTSEFVPGTEYMLPGSLPNDTYKYYYLGSTWRFGAPISNYTFVESNYSHYSLGFPYSFESRTAYAANSGESGFLPDPGFNRTDADVTILTLNNRLTFTGEVKDPFYRASSRATGASGLAEAWVSNVTLTGLACTEQYQFCNPNHKDGCTKLGSLYDFDVTTPPSTLALGPHQTAEYRILRFLLDAFRMNTITQFLRYEILLANQLIYGSFGISTPVPDHQWQLEIQNIHNTSFAGIQRTVIEHAAATNVRIRDNLSLFDHFIDQTDPDMLALCHNQMVKTSRYTSFSMLGLIIIVIVSAIIILTDVYLPWIVERTSKYRRVGRDQAITEWDGDDVLQLQRQVLEARGVGPWQNKFGRVPVVNGTNVNLKHSQAYAIPSNTVSHESLELLTANRDRELNKVPQSRAKHPYRYDSD